MQVKDLPEFIYQIAIERHNEYIEFCQKNGIVPTKFDGSLLSFFNWEATIEKANVWHLVSVRMYRSFYEFHNRDKNGNPLTVEIKESKRLLLEPVNEDELSEEIISLRVFKISTLHLSRVISRYLLDKYKIYKPKQ